MQYFRESLENFGVILKGMSVENLGQFSHKFNDCFIVNNFDLELERLADYLIGKNIVHFVNRLLTAPLKPENYLKLKIQHIQLSKATDKEDEALKKAIMHYQSLGLKTHFLPGRLLEFNKNFSSEYENKCPNTGFLAIIFTLELLRPENLWIVGLDFYQKDYLFRRPHQPSLKKQQEKMKRIELVNVFIKILKKYPETNINLVTYFDGFPELANLNVINNYKKKSSSITVPFSIKRRVREAKELISPGIKKVKKILKSRNGLIKKQIGSHIMFLRLNDAGISSTLLEMKPDSPDREAAFMHIIRNELKEGMTFVDIGANIGYVTLIAAELIGSSGKIYAIEPDPLNYMLLKKNIEVNGYSSFVSTYQMGISNRNGIAKFYVSDKSNLHSMIPTKNKKLSIDISVVTLDKFLKDKSFPNFIKMDIEGHEVEAVEGMYETIKNLKSPLKILIEVHPMYYSEDHDFEKQLRRLIEIGFKTKYIVSTGIARPKLFLRLGYEPFKTFFTDGWYRGIYKNVSNKHMLELACHEHKEYVAYRNTYTQKIVRSIMLEKSK